MKYFQQASLHELGFWKRSSIIIKSKIYSTKRTYCSSTTKVFPVNTTQIYNLPRYKTTDIDLIGHQSYHKGHFVSKVWHAYEIEKAHHNNQLVYPVYTWVKCTKFKLSVSIPSHINGFSCDKLLEPLSHQTLMRSKIANISRCTTGEHAIFI